MVTACQVLDFVFLKNVQNAVGPPELSQIVPPGLPLNVTGVHGSPRGPNVGAVTLASVGVTGVVAGSNKLCRLLVPGALATACSATSVDIVTSGSPAATEVPPLPEAPVRLLGNIST